jgi:hypothetical protein
MNTHQTIEEMKSALAHHIGDWEEDGHSPANYVRNTGLGVEVARVDRWCGGFQESHNPVTIGWRATHSIRWSLGCKGVIVIADCGSTEATIKEAKRLADEALAKLHHEWGDH